LNFLSPMSGLGKPDCEGELMMQSLSRIEVRKPVSGHGNPFRALGH
jgi:hypothetical protein